MFQNTFSVQSGNVIRETQRQRRHSEGVGDDQKKRGHGQVGERPGEGAMQTVRWMHRSTFLFRRSSRHKRWNVPRSHSSVVLQHATESSRSVGAPFRVCGSNSTDSLLKASVWGLCFCKSNDRRLPIPSAITSPMVRPHSPDEALTERSISA